MAVSAYNEDGSASGIDGADDDAAAESGSVYIFVGSGTDWTLQATIKASNTRAGALFGRGLALEGDTLVVGAPGEDSASMGVEGDQSTSGAPESGAIYVFVRSGTTWTQQAFIKASNAEADDEFGASVALSGDTLVVGAPGEASMAYTVDGDQSDNSYQQAGAVYVFTRQSESWSQQAYIKPSNTTDWNNCGAAVAVDSETLAFGCRGDDFDATGIVDNLVTNDLAPDSGATYVFVRESGVWSQQAYVKASNTGNGDYFGYSVALKGDTLAVGAIREDSALVGNTPDETDNSAEDSGAVYIFERQSTVWSQSAFLKGSSTDTKDTFGYRVALSAYFLAVSAILDDSKGGSDAAAYLDNSLSESGAVYLFERSQVWAADPHFLKPALPDVEDRFGRSIALDESTLAVGVSNEDSASKGISGDPTDNSSAESGAAYVFSN